MLLRRIGLWSGGYGQRSEYPDAAALVDTSWDVDEREDIAIYLRHGLVARAYMGYSPCRLCDKQDNGNLELTDGVYLWPEGLAHYVAEHSVRLPQEFVEHTYRMEESLQRAEVDEGWWLGRTRQ